MILDLLIRSYNMRGGDSENSDLLIEMSMGVNKMLTPLSWRDAKGLMPPEAAKKHSVWRVLFLTDSEITFREDP